MVDPAPAIDSTVAHPARRYHYWLGGKDNFAAGRPLTGDALLAESQRVEVWSDNPAHPRLAAHITDAGEPYL